MKVCVVVLNSIWYDPRVRKQISEYLRNQIDICCVGLKCNRYDEQKIREIPCHTEVVTIDPSYDGAQKSIRRKLLREWYRFKSVYDAIVFQSPDAVHANDLNALLPAYFAAKKCKCKLIYDAHEVFTDNMGITGVYKAYLHFIEKRLVRKVDLMVCVSHAAAEYFANKYRIKTPTVVTNCALKRETLTLPTRNKDIFEVLNHGQFYEGRGYDIMLVAAPLLKDYPKIRLALRGFGRMEESLRQIADKNSSENVIFYPPVLVQDLIPSASTASVGVAITEVTCLNFKLSVSNKLFEYAAAGLPVIMSDIPEHRLLNDRYHFGIVLQDNSPATFAAAVASLYTDKELYSQCAENAKRLAEEINWENEFGKILDFLQS